MGTWWHQGDTAKRAAAVVAAHGGRAAAVVAAHGGRAAAVVAAHGARAARAYALAPVRGVALVAGGVGLALAAGSIAVAGPWQGGQRVAERKRTQVTHVAQADGRVTVRPRPVPVPQWHPAQDVLLPATGTGTASGTSVGTASGALNPAAPLPTRSGLAAALDPAMNASVLGQVTASVVDAATGQTLYTSDANTPQTPASTNKIATSVAALSLLGPEHRFTTRVVTTSPGKIVLVGGGDPTLTAAATSGDDPQSSLATLADRTAAALRASGTGTVRLGYDISLFTGSAVHPIGINDNIALVQALTVDEGRIDPHSTENAARYSDPAATAADTFASLLQDRGVNVQNTPQQETAAAGATPVAEVSSQPLGEIVERMLTESDNDIAEALGHQAALAAHQPATFAGGAAAVRQALVGLGIQLGSARLYDASGLDGNDGIPAAVLTQLLTLAASPAHPELRSVLSGLPIAGFTGTLDNRYTDGSSTSGLGLVRAKTGSLQTVNTLAGLVVDRDGRLLVFAFMSNGSGAANSARAALDRLAGRVAVCGCR
ncbi:D-alanyl-D-alanine carboxypeptidase/D-alanyl-D-alanine-endopeptidase (penicillin-binding protein 4) [Streptacidiphilus sp. MAP12-16]|uniref:D-alanyl-D-alanine carboxypeptidase/D-alanyl-D-alanine endopeptidase n=1 Tax=Streptacidiphilus sp. MAP12-16 TaxID=3156300 RepID=UPI003515D7D7